MSPALPRTEAILNGQPIPEDPAHEAASRFAQQRAEQDKAAARRKPPTAVFEPPWLDLAARIVVISVTAAPVVALSAGFSVWVFRALSGI